MWLSCRCFSVVCAFETSRGVELSAALKRVFFKWSQSWSFIACLRLLCHCIQFVTCLELRGTILGGVKVKCKAVPLQAWTGPEGSRRLRLPDCKTIGTCGKVVSLTHRPSLPPLDKSGCSSMSEQERMLNHVSLNKSGCSSLSHWIRADAQACLTEQERMLKHVSLNKSWCWSLSLWTRADAEGCLSEQERMLKPVSLNKSGCWSVSHWTRILHVAHGKVAHSNSVVCSRFCTLKLLEPLRWIWPNARLRTSKCPAVNNTNMATVCCGNDSNFHQCKLDNFEW